MNLARVVTTLELEISQWRMAEIADEDGSQEVNVLVLSWSVRMKWFMPLVRCMSQREWDHMAERRMHDLHPAVQVTLAHVGVQHQVISSFCNGKQGNSTRQCFHHAFFPSLPLSPFFTPLQFKPLESMPQGNMLIACGTVHYWLLLPTLPIQAL